MYYSSTESFFHFNPTLYFIFYKSSLFPIKSSLPKKIKLLDWCGRVVFVHSSQNVRYGYFVVGLSGVEYKSDPRWLRWLNFKLRFYGTKQFIFYKYYQKMFYKDELCFYFYDWIKYYLIQWWILYKYFDNFTPFKFITSFINLSKLFFFRNKNKIVNDCVHTGRKIFRSINKKWSLNQGKRAWFRAYNLFHKFKDIVFTKWNELISVDAYLNIMDLMNAHLKCFAMILKKFKNIEI